MGVALLRHISLHLQLQLKKVDPFVTKRAHQISVTWAHTLLFLGNTLDLPVVVF